MAVAQWLLCVWQARAVQASWWAVLVLVLSLHGVDLVVDRVSNRRGPMHRGWPELLRAWITLIFINFACMILLGGLWSGGRALGTLLLLLVAWAVLLPAWEQGVPVMPLDMIGLAIAITAVCTGPPAPATTNHHDWMGWVHLIVLLHLLLMSNRHETISPWRLGSALLALPLVVGLAPEQTLTNDAAWLLLALPSIAMQMQQLVNDFIRPIVETICHPGLYSVMVILFFLFSLCSWLLFVSRIFIYIYLPLLHLMMYFVSMPGSKEGQCCSHHGQATTTRSYVLHNGLELSARLGLPPVSRFAAGLVGAGRSQLYTDARGSGCPTFHHYHTRHSRRRRSSHGHQRQVFTRPQPQQHCIGHSHAVVIVSVLVGI